MRAHYLDSVFDSVLASFNALAGSYLYLLYYFSAAVRVSGFFRASSLAFFTTLRAWPLAEALSASMCES